MKPIKKVMLQVSNQHFPTTVGILTQCSEYFTAMFLGRWCLDKQEDSSIFINGNPKLFKHLLEFLLRGVFLLVYNKCKGHDYLFYTQILKKVKYFDCPLLVLWLEDECYEKCVLMNFSSHIKDSPSLLDSCKVLLGDDELEFELERTTTGWLVIREELTIDRDWMTDSGYVDTFYRVEIFPG
ncbi:conserved hypothetical protein [Coccidioides posadasii str. Silveira]|uniref:BTB domain-containing protein n=1 Tax=Coccidioides posadasii (strain RMSCC 757 / Silveira) TaxID=443226 RepID=E9DH15_COCPS|nr:conserved hypothetical protein [Coccidioides posadasii str. Silveira]